MIFILALAVILKLYSSNFLRNSNIPSNNVIFTVAVAATLKYLHPNPSPNINTLSNNREFPRRIQCHSQRTIHQSVVRAILLLPRSSSSSTQRIHNKVPHIPDKVPRFRIPAPLPFPQRHNTRHKAACCRQYRPIPNTIPRRTLPNPNIPIRNSTTYLRTNTRRSSSITTLIHQLPLTNTPTPRPTTPPTPRHHLRRNNNRSHLRQNTTSPKSETRTYSAAAAAPQIPTLATAISAHWSNNTNSSTSAPRKKINRAWRKKWWTLFAKKRDGS
mmetsp:Transcript_55393/g.66655  ORF Transcript_55393/g.66655 Transcript_55393/m.66655 type:complete len:272 (-) Transcript_55393:594-1409(-)